jgi:hypothetical protein
MSRLIRTFCKAGSFRDTPTFVIHHILTASIMHFLNATTPEPTIRKQSVGRFRVCVEALEEIQPMWQHARKAINLRAASKDGPVAAQVALSPERADIEENFAGSGSWPIDMRHDTVQDAMQEGQDQIIGDLWALPDEHDASVDINALWDFGVWPDLSQAPGIDWMGDM